MLNQIAFNCIRIFHISAALNTRISVILSHFRSAAATWQEMLLIFHIFSQPCHLGWNSKLIYFLRCVRMWRNAGNHRGILSRGTDRSPDCHGALNRRFVPGLMCSLELRLLMKEWESAYKKPPTSPTERCFTWGKSLVSASTFSQTGAYQVPGITWVLHPSTDAWMDPDSIWINV